MYTVKEIFYTLQGEGANAGGAAVFCRFAGCNLWSGRESDRALASCTFCDTDFVGVHGASGGKYETVEALADVIANLWPRGAPGERFVVLTGGEPLLQIDEKITKALHARSFRVAVETNGTLEPPVGIDWVCVSPKAGAPLRLTRGDELKVVFPQPGLDMQGLESLDFRHRFVQPMDGPSVARNTRAATQWCLQNPRWRLSLQMHKTLGIP